MKFQTIVKRAAFAFLGFAFALCFLSGSISAQTKTRKRPVTPPSSTATNQSEPLIISRAEDFPDTGGAIVQPVKDPASENAASDFEQTSALIEQLRDRIKTLEDSRKPEADAKQKRLALNLDILTKAEQRAETMRKQLFEMIEKESAIRSKLDSVDIDLRPEAIERSVTFAGSLRPEELRDARRKNLQAEKANLQTVLTEVQRTKANLDLNLQKADMLVEKLRVKLEKEIDQALLDDEDPPKNN